MAAGPFLPGQGERAVLAAVGAVGSGKEAA
jgi:hypothetical protein